MLIRYPTKIPMWTTIGSITAAFATTSRRLISWFLPTIAITPVDACLQSVTLLFQPSTTNVMGSRAAMIQKVDLEEPKWLFKKTAWWFANCMGVANYMCRYSIQNSKYRSNLPHGVFCSLAGLTNVHHLSQATLQPSKSERAVVRPTLCTCWAARTDLREGLVVCHNKGHFTIVSSHP